MWIHPRWYRGLGRHCQHTNQQNKEWFHQDGGTSEAVCCLTVWSCSWFLRERKGGGGRHTRVIHTSGLGRRRWRKTVIHYFQSAERHYGQLLQVTDERLTVLSVSTLTAHEFLLLGLTTAPRHLSRHCCTGQTGRAIFNNGAQGTHRRRQKNR